MTTTHRLPAGTLAGSVYQFITRPNAMDFEAVRRANIPQTKARPGYTGARAGSKVKTPAIYAAARSGGFRYPNQFKAPGPGQFWKAKNDKH